MPRHWQHNLCYTEHFNKDLFWNWVGKVDHNFSSNDRVFFRWGKNERNEVRNTTAIRSGPAQNGQLPPLRANRALVGDWVHIFGSRHSLQRARQLHLLPGVELFPGLARFRRDASCWPASLVSQFPAATVGGIFPVVNMDDFVGTLARIRARTGTGTTRFSQTCR